MSKVFTFKSRVWVYPGDSPWHFATINKSISKEIKKFETWPRRGFGSIPVLVKIGKTKWKTSVFPEKKGTYLLPIKKEVRKHENIKDGSFINIFLEVIT